MRASRAYAVAKFEFGTVVRRWPYLVATFGLPLLFGALGIATIGTQASAIESASARATRVAFVDESSLAVWNEFDWELVHVEFVRVESRDKARELLTLGKVDAAYVVSANTVRYGELIVMQSGSYAEPFSPAVDVDFEVELAVKRALLRDVVDDELLDNVVEPLVFTRSTQQGGRLAIDGDPAITWLSRVAVPVALAMLLFTALITASGYVVQSTATDRSNRVAEVLLASLRPNELLTGKLLGLGAAGLLQIVVWFAMGACASSVIAQATMIEVAVSSQTLAVAVVYFLLGYAFVASLMLSTSVFGENLAESQKLAVVWAVAAASPLVFLGSLLAEPHGALAVALSWFPLSAPAAMTFRVAIDPVHVPAWQVCGSAGLLFACTLVALRVGASMFRAGLLWTGERPTWDELRRQMRATR